MREENVTVSVIVPVHNTEPYLRECLDSILSQKLTNIELLCVDDGSTDASPSILKNYAERDSRVRIIPQRPGGKGPGIARNTAMDQARGEYIAFVDSDDRIHKDMLRLLHRAATSYDAEIAMSAIKLFNARGERGVYAPCSYKRLLGNLAPQTFSWTDFRDSLFSLRFVAWNKLYRRDFLSKWNIRFSEGIFYEDLAFVFPAMLRATRMRLVPKHLYFNRREREGATTFGQGSRVFDAIAAMEQFEEFLTSDPMYEELLERFEAFRFERLYSYLHKNSSESLPTFFGKLKEYAGSPALANSPYLRETTAQKRRLIQERDLLDFLTYELWDARATNAKLVRQKRFLLRLIMPAVLLRRLVINVTQRLRGSDPTWKSRV